MIVKTNIATQLKSHIEQFIYYDHYQPDHAIQRVVPDGSVNLIFELDGMTRHVYNNDSLTIKNNYDSSWIAGIQKEYITISAHPDSSMLVAFFTPGGAYPFFKLPINELNDQIIPAENVFGPAVREVRSTIMDQSGGEAKISCLENWLIGQADLSCTIPPSVLEAVEAFKANPSLKETKFADIVRSSRYSEKQFIQHFKKFVGVTPKYFQRILRFNEVLHRIHNEQSVEWPKVYIESGYYDQAHFIKDFSRFSGINPQTFVDKFNEQINFFPLDKEH